jgi:hypothetical protein
MTSAPHERRRRTKVGRLAGDSMGRSALLVSLLQRQRLASVIPLVLTCSAASARRQLPAAEHLQFWGSLDWPTAE